MRVVKLTYYEWSCKALTMDDMTYRRCFEGEILREVNCEFESATFVGAVGLWNKCVELILLKPVAALVTNRSLNCAIPVKNVVLRRLNRNPLGERVKMTPN